MPEVIYKVVRVEDPFGKEHSVRVKQVREQGTVYKNFAADDGKWVPLMEYLREKGLR